jgi:outer membrane lipoprotein
VLASPIAGKRAFQGGHYATGKTAAVCSLLSGKPMSIPKRRGFKMVRHRFSRWFLISLYLFAASGCAYPISRELREEVNKDLTFPMVLQNPTAYVGSTVIWGGEIISTTNSENGTEILVLDTPLDYRGMPEGSEYSGGRFIAKSPQFLDPALYKAGKKITVGGEVTGKETKPLGKTQYTYPVVGVEQLHLWTNTQYRLHYNPYWNWYVPYYGPHYGGFYGDFDLNEEEGER